MEQYDSIGWLYEILYAEYGIDKSGQAFMNEHEALLEKYSGCKMHDASCGNGIQALALKKAGCDITASDASVEMVRLARKNAMKLGMSLEPFVADWKEIYAKRHESYELVLCTGNSICHSAGRSDRISVLSNFHEILNGGGTLIVDSRNWEKLIREKEEHRVLIKREYEGKDYIPIYMWRRLALEECSILKMVFIELAQDRQEVYERRLHFVPFTHGSIIEDCKSVGFRITEDTYNQKTDFYSVYAQK